MLERLARLAREYDEVLAALSDPEVLADQNARIERSRRA
ncbi:MAG: peptide chain release factor 1, partial [Acidimicrobiales bacterium]